MKAPILYLQSGGPTAVLNASARGVIETARRLGVPLWAARDGLAGLLADRLVDTSRASDSEVARLSQLPGASFGVSRHMMPTFEQEPAAWWALRDILERHGIHHLLLNGGNGSMGSAARLAEFERHTGYPLSVIGIPKTIDNDLLGTDFSPGFPSAAKYLATSMREVGLDMASLGQGRVFIMETMGRHTGWLAASSAAARQSADDAPQLVLVPEVPFDPQHFLAQLDACLTRLGHCAIAVAEGLRGLDGKPVTELRHDDIYGHEQLGGAGTWLARLIKRERGLTPHVAQVDCLQRAARHWVSAVDVQWAHAAGACAVEWALGGEHGVMVAMQRADRDNDWRLTPVRLAEIGDKEYTLPPAFLDPQRLTVTPAFLAYLRPLLQGDLPLPVCADGLPDYRPVRWETL